MTPTLLTLTLLLGAAAVEDSETLPTAPPPRETRDLLPLAQALRNADEHQPLILAAVANAQAASARVDENRGPLLPQISGSAALVGNQYFGGNSSSSNTVVGVPSGGGGAGGGGGGASTFVTGNGFHTTLGLTASQLLWDFGATWNLFKSFEAAAAQFHFTAEEQTIQSHLVVRSAYYNAHALDGLERVARETLDNEKKHLNQTTALVQVGSQPQIALAQERTTYANDVFQVFQAQGNFLGGKALLNQAMGIEGPLDYAVENLDAPAVTGEDRGIDDLLPQALRARPAYAAIAKQVESARLQMSAMEGAIWPTLRLTGGISTSASRPENLAGGFFGELLLNWTIFNGLANVGQIHEQQANLLAAQAQADQLRQQIRVDLEQTRLQVVSDRSGLQSTHFAVVNAREQLRLAEARYAQGVGNIIELGDAQVAATSAEVQEIQAKYNLNNARSTLLAKLGQP